MKAYGLQTYSNIFKAIDYAYKNPPAVIKWLKEECYWCVDDPRNPAIPDRKADVQIMYTKDDPLPWAVGLAASRYLEEWFHGNVDCQFSYR